MGYMGYINGVYIDVYINSWVSHGTRPPPQKPLRFSHQTRNPESGGVTATAIKQMVEVTNHGRYGRCFSGLPLRQVTRVIVSYSFFYPLSYK